MNNKIKIISIAIVSLFFSKLVSAEVAPGFNSWDDVKACLLYTSDAADE